MKIGHVRLTLGKWTGIKVIAEKTFQLVPFRGGGRSPGFSKRISLTNLQPFRFSSS